MWKSCVFHSITPSLPDNQMRISAPAAWFLDSKDFWRSVGAGRCQCQELKAVWSQKRAAGPTLCSKDRLTRDFKEALKPELKALWFLTSPTAKVPFPSLHTGQVPTLLLQTENHFTPNSKKLLFHFPFSNLPSEPKYLFNYFSLDFNFWWCDFILHLLIVLVY